MKSNFPLHGIFFLITLLLSISYVSSHSHANEIIHDSDENTVGLSGFSQNHIDVVLRSLNLGDTPAVPSLIKAMEDEDPYMRYMATWLLRRTQYLINFIMLLWRL